MIPFVAPAPVKLSFLRARRVLLAALAGVLLPVTAWAQVSYTGTAATQNFGSVAIGSTSAAATFSFSVTAGTMVGSIGVVTQGAPNLDFDSSTGGTCTATTYASTTTCTVNVTFKPRFAGWRRGAIVFYSAANQTGNQLGSVPINGVGTGPQIAYSPGAVVNILSEIGDTSLGPNSTAVDGAGDLFIADRNGNGIVEVPAGSHTWTEIYPTANGIKLNYPACLTVDGAGNLFVANAGGADVLEVPAGGGDAIAIDPMVNGTGLSLPDGVAVDAAGDLFISDMVNNWVVEVPAGNGAPVLINPTVAGKTLNAPTGLALDIAGDLFIADYHNNRVVEVPAGGGAAVVIDPTVDGLELNIPSQVALDGAGDLFIADYGNNRVVEVPAGGGAATATQPAGQPQTNALTLDDAGDQFLSTNPGQAVVEVLRSQPPTLNFPTLTIVDSTDTNDGTLTAQVQNVGNAALTLTALSYPVDFSEASGDANACTSSTSLSAGQECDVPAEFTPESIGSLSESVTLTDNALNMTAAQQSVAVSGTAVPAGAATHLSITTTATVESGIPFSITVTALNSSNSTAASYDGTVIFTSSDPGFVNPGPLTLASGVGHATVTLSTSGGQTITATDTMTSSLTGSVRFEVSTPHFSVTTTAAVVAGTPFSITVKALTGGGNQLTNYDGTMSFTSSDPGFVNPGPLTLSSGVGHATVTLETLGNQTITATDTTTSSLTGTGSFAVASAPPPPPLVVYTGTAANQNFGSQAVGSTSAANTFSFSVDGGTAIGSIVVLTTGLAGLDFASATGGTCTATTYASTSACTVNVTFKPKSAGVRQGAVVFFSGSNNTGTVLGSVAVYGVGTGPQISFGFGAPLVVAQGQLNPYGSFGIGDPTGLATDAAGDVFVNLGDFNSESAGLGGEPIFDSYSPGVVELLAGGGSVGAANVSGSTGLAVDGAGDLFITGVGGSYGGAVVEAPVGGGAYSAIYPVVNNIGLSGASGVTVDPTGDLFIADAGNNRVVEVPAGGGAALAIEPSVGGTGLSSPSDVKLDAAGDLFIADQGNNRVVEVPAGGGAAIAIGEGESTYSLALDALGDVFILGGGNGPLVEMPAGGGAAISLPDWVGNCFSPGGAVTPGYIATDSAGDLFFSSFTFYSVYDPSTPGGYDNYFFSFVCELQRSQPPALNFPTATIDGTTDTTDGTQTVQIQNIGNAPLALSGLSYPADFSKTSGDPIACTGTTSLSVGQVCDVPIEFTPKNAGALNENVTLTDNTLNATGTQQSIAVSGTGIAMAPSALTSPTPGSTFTSTSVTFHWTAPTGATAYLLHLGSTGVGSSNLDSSGKITSNTVTFSSLPANGETIYARLYTY